MPKLPAILYHINTYYTCYHKLYKQRKEQYIYSACISAIYLENIGSDVVQDPHDELNQTHINFVRKHLLKDKGHKQSKHVNYM